MVARGGICGFELKPEFDVLSTRNTDFRNLHAECSRPIGGSNHKKESHCPIVIDPSQGAGRADLVKAMCKGAVAMGADALLIEVHPNPAEAWSDCTQQLSLEGFVELMKALRPLILAVGRAADGCSIG